MLLRWEDLPVWVSVCVCVCVSIWVGMCVSVSVCRYVCLSLFVCPSFWLCVGVYIGVSMGVCASVWLCQCVWLWMAVCLIVYRSVCVSVSMTVSVCTTVAICRGRGPLGYSYWVTLQACGANLLWVSVYAVNHTYAYVGIRNTSSIVRGPYEMLAKPRHRVYMGFYCILWLFGLYTFFREVTQRQPLDPLDLALDLFIVIFWQYSEVWGIVRKLDFVY